MIRITTHSLEDYWLLSMACSLKQLQVQFAESSTSQSPMMEWSAGSVTGAAAILLYLEASLPEPGLFPNGNIGMPLALLYWRRAMSAATAENTATLMANARLVTRQLDDGRSYLQGDQPGLADLCSGSWLMPKRDLLEPDHPMQPWLGRLSALQHVGSVKDAQSLVGTTELGNMDDYTDLLHIDRNSQPPAITSPLDE